MIEIFTFLDRRDATLLSRSSEMRDACSHLGAAMALSTFLDESEHGLEPPLVSVDPEADRLLTIRTENENRQRIEAMLQGTDFTEEDVLVSAVKHMIAGDMRALKVETAIEVAEVKEAQFGLADEDPPVAEDVESADEKDA